MITSMTWTVELHDLKETLKNVSGLGSSVKMKDKQQHFRRTRGSNGSTPWLSSSFFFLCIVVSILMLLYSGCLNINVFFRIPMNQLLNSLIPSTNCVSFWRRLGPVPPDTSLGSDCKSSLQCLLFVPHSHCDWDNRTCACQPYHIQSNSSSCLPASLLGYACAVDAQCTLKVPNSLCQEGICQCKDNFVPYRRDKCLPRKYSFTRSS